MSDLTINQQNDACTLPTLQADLQEVDDVFRHGRHHRRRLVAETPPLETVTRGHTNDQEVLEEMGRGRKTDVPPEELKQAEFHREILLGGVWTAG